MANAPGNWTSDAFSQRLRALANAEPGPVKPAPEADPRLIAFREAAAVLADFDPEQLKPVGRVKVEPGDFSVIIPESKAVIGAEGRRTLRSDIRGRTLRRLREEGRLKKVLEAARPREVDQFHSILLAAVKGQSLELSGRSEPELSVMLELTKLMGAGSLGLPDPDEIRRELGRARLLAPRRHVADAHFRGRAQELEDLRNYVGVADPETVTGSLFRKVRDVLDLRKRPPLMIFGPGGMGKSALMSRFVLEHAHLDEDRRFPFAFLDFDRPGITVREPLTLLVEVLFQLGAQYPSISEECTDIRRRLVDHVSWAFHDQEFRSSELESYQQSRGLTTTMQERDIFIPMTVSLFQKIARDNQPLLLVFDTFEEVQYHGRAHIPGLFAFLQQFQQSLPRLRVVLAGRTRESEEKVTPLALGPLAAGDAMEFLESFDVPPDLAGEIVDNLGGNPLTLRLAMKVFKREGQDAKALHDIEGARSFFRKVDDELVQGQLYRRFLNHIPDEQVRAVAHPGLVLRRLTPALILEVLAGPCQLLIESREDAADLFARLARQDTLVSWEGDAIVHRSDVRRIMVGLLRKAESEKVDLIHAGAVRYYEPFDDPVSRAEEIYHRYCLGQDEALIESRWMTGIEDRLGSAIGEIPENLRPHLAARTGGEVLTTQDWNKADVRDWELHVSERVRQLNEQARYEEALELLRGRDDRTEASPLFNLEVVALARLGALEEAWHTGNDALVRVRKSGDTEQELELLGSLGSVARRMGDFQSAQGLLFAAADLAEQRGEITRSLDSLLLALESGRWSGEVSSMDIRSKLSELLVRVEPKDMMSAPTLFSSIAKEVDEINPEMSALILDVLQGVETVKFMPPEGEEMLAQTRATDTGLTSTRAGQLYRLMNRLFRDEDELEEFLRLQLGTGLRDLSRGGSVQASNFEVITALVRHGKTADLVAALRRFEPQNLDLVEIAHELGI